MEKDFECHPQPVLEEAVAVITRPLDRCDSKYAEAHHDGIHTGLLVARGILVVVALP